MKIAIHNRPGSYSDYWIEYCQKNDVQYKLVNAYDNDIIEQLKDCDAFMWHHHQGCYKDMLFAKQLLFSLQASGIKTFPDFNTGWHFDDKVGQKYLLESINAPFVPSFVFYSKDDAMKWVGQSKFPKVFKLRGGAGSNNVWLVHDKKEAKKFVSKAFGKGFPQNSIVNKVSENIRKHKEGKLSLYGVLKDIAAFYLKPGTFHKMFHPEKGYAYFQEFIPNNESDIRVCVVGDKAFAIKRMVRQNDFRASGSGHMHYAKSEIDERCVQISFDVAKRLKLQCVGLDYIFDNKNNPLIVEMGYGFTAKRYLSCEGYWTSDMVWHEGNCFDFCGWMVESLINQSL